jgi:hypothetical protein
VEICCKEYKRRKGSYCKMCVMKAQMNCHEWLEVGSYLLLLFVNSF